MWQHWRLLQWYFLGYAILTGFYTLQYDFKSRKFQKSKLLQFYAIAFNIFVLLLLPIHFLFSLKDIEIYQSFPMAKQINLIRTLVRTVTVFSALILRLQYERSLREIINELSHIEVNYFHRITNTIKSKRYWHLNLLLYGKFTIWILVTSYAVFGILQQFWLGRIFKMQITFVIINLMNLLQGLALYHYVILWHICKRYHMINDKLLAIFHMANDLTETLHLDSSLRLILANELSLDLCELSTTHGKVTRLLAQMNNKFKLKLLMIVLSYFVNYVSIGYYIATLVSINFKDWHLAGMLLTVSIYLIMLLNIFLLMVLSEDVTQTSVKMSNILQQFIGLPTLGTYFERSVSVFTNITYIFYPTFKNI